MLLQAAALGLAWTVLTFVLIRPVLEHLTGSAEDMSSYAGLRATARPCSACSSSRGRWRPSARRSPTAATC
jgi:hypothetical protein